MEVPGTPINPSYLFKFELKLKDNADQTEHKYQHQIAKVRRNASLHTVIEWSINNCTTRHQLTSDPQKRWLLMNSSSHKITDPIIGQKNEKSNNAEFLQIVNNIDTIQTLTFLLPSRHLPDTLQIYSIFLLDTLQMFSRNIPENLQTHSRPLQDTYKRTSRCF